MICARSEQASMINTVIQGYNLIKHVLGFSSQLDMPGTPYQKMIKKVLDLNHLSCRRAMALFCTLLWRQITAPPNPTSHLPRMMHYFCTGLFFLFFHIEVSWLDNNENLGGTINLKTFLIIFFPHSNLNLRNFNLSYEDQTNYNHFSQKFSNLMARAACTKTGSSVDSHTLSLWSLQRVM